LPVFEECEHGGDFTAGSRVMEGESVLAMAGRTVCFLPRVWRRLRRPGGNEAGTWRTWRPSMAPR
jgi:hypothetical protein